MHSRHESGQTECRLELDREVIHSVLRSWREFCLTEDWKYQSCLPRNYWPFCIFPKRSWPKAVRQGGAHRRRPDGSIGRAEHKLLEIILRGAFAKAV